MFLQALYAESAVAVAAAVGLAILFVYIWCLKKPKRR
jgi:hypothetical protein